MKALYVDIDVHNRAYKLNKKTQPITGTQAIAASQELPLPRKAMQERAKVGNTGA